MEVEKEKFKVDKTGTRTQADCSSRIIPVEPGKLMLESTALTTRPSCLLLVVEMGLYIYYYIL
jgi:hypothetical protein